MSSAPVVVITGASQGIGAAIALAFSRLPGTRLALVSRSLPKLEAVAARCREHGADAAVFTCDVRDAASVRAMSAAVLRHYPQVDVLVNNAGSFIPSSFAEMDVAQFDEMIAVNLRSVFLVTQAFLPGLQARQQGDIFNISSVAGLQGLPGCAGYGTAKFGVTGLSKVMRLELRKQGIRVCCVYPGATATPSWDGSGVPEDRMSPADDIARLVVSAHQLDRRSMLEDIVIRPQLGDVQDSDLS